MIVSVLEGSTTTNADIDLQYLRQKLDKDPNNVRLQKMVKLLEDAIIIYRLSKAKNTLTL